MKPNSCGEYVLNWKGCFPMFSPYNTLWLFNIATENRPFIDDFPINSSIYKGFSMAMLNNQMVYLIFIDFPGVQRFSFSKNLPKPRHFALQMPMSVTSPRSVMVEPPQPPMPPWRFSAKHLRERTITGKTTTNNFRSLDSLEHGLAYFSIFFH